MAYRVLIVDDSPVMRTFIRRVMTISGFECEKYFEAGNGLEALALLGQEHADVILTDINMPKMDGEALMRALAADCRTRVIPVLVVSTDATSARIQSLLALGAKGYVTKPFPPESLREELERVLGVSHG